MTSHIRHLLFVLILTPLISAPAAAGGLSHFALHAGSNGFGLSFGTSDWGVYGASWHDPAWQPNYETSFAGYGEWCLVAGLGRVWRPWVNTGWRPFTHGRWVWTEVGWTWVSYEPWGYYPHHYGNWALVSFGWVWVPGWTYRAAPVRWVGCGSYVGWYPQPPPGWSHSARAYHHGWNNGYNRGYADGWRDARHATWVPWRDMGAANLSARTTAYNRVVRSAPAGRPQGLDAPTRSAVTRRGAAVPETRLERRTVTAGGREVTVARPEGMRESVERHGARTSRAALADKALEPRRTNRQTTPAARAPSSERTSPSRQGVRRPDPSAGARTVQPEQKDVNRFRSQGRSEPRSGPRTQSIREPSRRTAPSNRNTTARIAPETTRKVRSASQQPRARDVDTGLRQRIPSSESASRRAPRSEGMKSPQTPTTDKAQGNRGRSAGRASSSRREPTNAQSKRTTPSNRQTRKPRPHPR